ncbi:MAG: bifunctional riboflavin kinase/FMN adenylyltransferase [Oscillospiraceae bacterium]|nr:bifunctional riboflavin kinase/FMN adenylyltransferase [Oscillospiraceae bacterium]
MNIALGSFDGLHAAHRAVLRGATAVLLFSEHPQVTLHGQAPLQLLTNDERAHRLQAAGLRLLHVDFAELAALPPAQFIALLRERYGATGLRCGHNFRFGAGAQGNIALLRELCATHGMTLSIVPRIAYRGDTVSSTRIRAALQQGEITQVNAMLGRAFGYSFPVEHGARLGRVLGAPTLNQHFTPGYCVPKAGVYASRACVDGAWWPAVTNIGLRPTISNHSEATEQHRRCPRSETHIPGFAGDLYGQRVPVRLLRFVREERRFGSVEELKAQILQDIQI